MIARIKKNENADSTEFFQAEPSASKGKCGISCDSNKPPYPEKDYLREEGRAPGTEWVMLAQDPVRRGHEKAGFANQGHRKA